MDKCDGFARRSHSSELEADVTFCDTLCSNVVDVVNG